MLVTLAQAKWTIRSRTSLAAAHQGTLAAVGSHLAEICVTFRAHLARVEASVLARARCRRTIHRALECLEPIDLAFRLAAAPSLRDGVPHGLDVAHQRSCELPH